MWGFLTGAYAIHARPRKSKIFGCSKTFGLAMPLFSPRFRQVGTLVLHGKGGTLSLLQVVAVRVPTNFESCFVHLIGIPRDVAFESNK